MKRQSRQRSRPLAKPNPVGRKLPVWKKLLFGAFTCVLLFGVLEAVLALAGTKPILYESDPYVGFAGNVPLFVKQTGADGQEIFSTAKNKSRTFNPQQFPAKKPGDAFRIFCMGGSTTFGHPYDDTTSFCGWLRAMLPQADPSRQWELINCGGISYASYRIALLMEELARYQPDLFIIYNGENEFLEHRTYSQVISMPRALRGLASFAGRTRVYSVAKSAMDQLKERSPNKTKREVLPGEVKTMLERVEGPEAYQRDDELQKRTVEHFRFNLARMVEIADSCGAKVIFVTSASNLRDCSPFKNESRAKLGDAGLQRWRSATGAAAQLFRARDWTGTLARLDEALGLDDRYAEAHYFRGRVLWQLDRFDEARAAFLRARDEDVCPLRALTPIVDSVREVAAERQVSLVDFVKLVGALSDHQTPGDDWFLDHVHPTIEGNRRLALALMEEMKRTGLAHFNPAWNEAAASHIRRGVESRLDAKAHGTGIGNVAKVMAWAGKYEEAYRASLRAEALSPGDAAIQFEVGKNALHLQHQDEAVSHLRQALRINPRFTEAHLVLANALSAGGRLQEADASYRAALELRPDYPELRSNYGTLLMRTGKTNEALQNFHEAVRLAPDYAEARSNLGWLLAGTGRLTEALAQFREAYRLKPGLLSPQLGLAWLLATHPDDKLREPSRAIALAERLAESSHFEDWAALDTLAAAYASAGRYGDATRTEQKALSLVFPAKPDEVAALRQRLALYEGGKPFREKGH